MPTISKEFSEIYGSNGPLNYRKNISINNLAKNIVPNQEFNNNVVKNIGDIKTEPIIKPTVSYNMPWTIILFISIILIIIGVIYYNIDHIYALFDKINNIDVLNKKTDDFIKKYEDEKIQYSINQNEHDDKKEKESEEKGGLNELNNKINSITSYKDNQKVKEDGFCYIGYERGQRECTNVFDGDICMSGQVFPTMDICINPRLRP
jgi:hypothetical protein